MGIREWIGEMRVDTHRLAEDLLRSDRQPILVASHPRSGTHLLIDMFRRQFANCAAWKYPLERLDRLYLSLDVLADPRIAPPHVKAAAILGRCRRPLLKTHAFPDYALFPFESHQGQIDPRLADAIRQRATKFYIYRDGRKVMCSYHALEGSRLSLGEFMRQQVGGQNRVQAWTNHVARWRNEPGVTFLKMETLIRQPGPTLSQLEEVLGESAGRRQPLLPPRAKSVWTGRRDRLIAMRPESTAILPKQTAGPSSWSEAFTAADRQFFHEHGGDMLIQLGYEPTDAWVSSQPTRATAGGADALQLQPA